MMSFRLAMLGLTFSLLSIGPAPAQVTIDIAKITCDQFILWTVTDPRYIAIWLSGYYNGKRNNTVIDPQALKDNSDKVTDYCRGNRARTVMQAVETVLVPPK
jgi:acid stress chaperone HdeB